MRYHPIKGTGMVPLLLTSADFPLTIQRSYPYLTDKT